MSSLQEGEGGLIGRISNVVVTIRLTRRSFQLSFYRGEGEREAFKCRLYLWDQGSEDARGLRTRQRGT
jgi:hypothetical protein